MDIAEKISDILNIIKEIEKENQLVSDILLEGFYFSVNVLQERAKNSETVKTDVSEQLEVIARVLGFSLEDLVKSIVAEKTGTQIEVLSTKEPDAETLKFITADLDDYERFLAESKATESLDFLKSEL